MSMVFLLIMIIVLLLFIGLEIFRRYYTKYINKVFKGEEKKKVPSFFLLLRFVFIISFILLIILPISWYSYSAYIEPSDDMTLGTYYEDDLHFEASHNDLYRVPGVSYQFKIQMDIFELTEAILSSMNEEYDYYVIDNVIYFNMKSHFVKLYKVDDSKYFKDKYILKFDYINLSNEMEELDLSIPFPTLSMDMRESIEFISTNSYSVNVNVSWEYFIDYYQRLDKVEVEDELITLKVFQLIEEGSEYSLVQYTIELSYSSGKVYFKITDVSFDIGK